ncbi:MAG: hypothetical protein MK142_02420 [Pseudomonadales bacterium]|nr:hypothetical protein [Pseudomonadales bacterium]
MKFAHDAGRGTDPRLAAAEARARPGEPRLEWASAGAGTCNPGDAS